MATLKFRSSTVAPVAPAESSIWLRIKAKASTVIATVTKIIKRVVARIKPIATRVWTVALRPFLQGVIAGTALATVIVCTFVAPITTLVVLPVAGVTCFALARGLEKLEKSDSKLVRFVLAAIDVMARVVQVAAYLGAALLALALGSVSFAFAAYTVVALFLMYIDMRHANAIAFGVWCVLSGNIFFGLAWLLWRAARIPARGVAQDFNTAAYGDVVHEVHNPRTTVSNVPKGAEEMVDVIDDWSAVYENDAHCASCSTALGALRVFSNLPGNNDALCSSCYDLECEDIALQYTGVSLKKRSVNVMLNAKGLAALSEFQKSEADPGNHYWATVAWWRDKAGRTHDRHWQCFVAGMIVADVHYDHSRKVYRATVNGRFEGTKASLTQAQRLATDAFNAMIVVVDDAADATGELLRDHA